MTIFVDNVEVSASISNSFKNKFSFGVTHKEPNITFLYIIHGTVF